VVRHLRDTNLLYYVPFVQHRRRVGHVFNLHALVRSLHLLSARHVNVQVSMLDSKELTEQSPCPTHARLPSTQRNTNKGIASIATVCNWSIVTISIKELCLSKKTRFVANHIFYTCIISTPDPPWAGTMLHRPSERAETMKSGASKNALQPLEIKKGNRRVEMKSAEKRPRTILT
jgi:hypothetical protein